MSLPSSAVAFLAGQVERVRQLKTRKRIVFPEGCDPRVLSAAKKLAEEGLVQPILIGDGKNISSKVRFVNPDRKKYARLYFERRRAKGITEIEAEEISSRPLNFAGLMRAAGRPEAFARAP